jgi:chromosome partitioning protein
MKIITIYSIKGGVGKTASAVNLAYFAAKSGLKTLLWDFDPQAATSFYLRVKPKLKKSIKKAVQGKFNIENEIKATDFENLHIVPSDFSYRNIDLFLDSESKPKKALSEMLKTAGNDYDILIIDAPPGITLLSESLMKSSDVLAVPVIPTTLSVRTCEMMLDYINENEIKKLRPAMFFTMADKRRKIHRNIIDATEFKGAVMLNSIIPISSDVESMGIHRAPLGAFAPKSKASEAYLALWQEIVNLL